MCWCVPERKTGNPNIKASRLLQGEKQKPWQVTYTLDRKDRKNANMSVYDAIDRYIASKENVLSPSTILPQKQRSKSLWEAYRAPSRSLLRKNAGNKNREPHGGEIRDLGAAACRWLGWRDSNPRDDGVKVRCLTAWRQPSMENTEPNFTIKLRVPCGVEDGIRTHGLQSHNLAL